MPPKRKNKTKGKRAQKDKVPTESRAQDVTSPGPEQEDVDISTAQQQPSVMEKSSNQDASKQASSASFSKQIVPVCPSTSEMSIEKAMRRVGFEMKQGSFQSKHWPFPKRPGFGTIGKKIPLIANRFIIDIPDGCVYHYDIKIYGTRKAKNKEPEKYRCLSTRFNRKVLESALLQAKLFKSVRPAYDGKNNLITRNPLPIKDHAEVKVTFEDKLYIISIEPVSKEGQSLPEISLEPIRQLLGGKVSSMTEEIQTGIIALNIILKHGPALKYVPVYNSFYYPPNERDLPPLGGGREIWLGYHQSIQISQWKATVNIDMSATVFYESGPLINHLMNVLYPHIPKEDWEQHLRRMHLQQREVNMLYEELRGLQIEVTHLPYPRKYRIRGITCECASDVYFEEDINGKKRRISVAEYFRKKYSRYTLRYPNLPCINGTEKKNTFLPFEICNVTRGQHCNKQIDDDLKRTMVRTTCRHPKERFRSIRETVESMTKELEKGTGDSPSFFKEFGIRINTSPMKFDGRELEPPILVYNSPQLRMEDKNVLKNCKPKDGSWTMEDKNFFKSCEPINRWILVSFSNMRDLSQLAKSLQQGGYLVGIKIAKPVAMKTFGANASPSSILTKEKKELPDLQLAFVVLPFGERSKSLYREIKTICETKLGLMTQCISEPNARKCDRKVICNLCQKINSKMGGKNTSLASDIKPLIFRKPVIIIGADCNHPSPGDTVEPSIAAAVGSLDSGPSKFVTSLRVQLQPGEKPNRNGRDQPKKREMILDLKGMVKELLLAFYQHTNKQPEKIIFYRDGISEGEFADVLQKEISQIREACQDMNREYKPPITFIVVGKRHHTRFMPQFDRDGKDKAGNIPPGTVVDTVVTHPVYSDYFLCSHAGIIGTSRPAHYTVLCDDNEFSADELQILTYYLCHTYSRCTRSISIPCPVMYAHLAAYRAKQYLYDLTKDRGGNVTIEDMRQAIDVVQSLKQEMYFA